MNRFVAWMQIPIVVVVLTLCPGAASAQMGGKLETGGNIALGVAGELEGKINGTKQAGQELDVTAGLNLYALYEVLKYLDVGGKFNFVFWRTDNMRKAAIDRMAWIEFDAVVRGKYGFLNDKLYIYLAMPIGLTISVPNKDFKNRAIAGVKTGAGVNLSLVTGINYQFWKGLGAFFDLGWVFHYTNNKGPNNLEIEGTANQMSLNFGAFYRF
jgi:hypothetical protein